MITVCRDRVCAELQERLAAFERDFSYPLDARQRFRISHQPDYLGFFRRMGSADCLVAEVAGEIAGVMATVSRKLRLPGQVAPKNALYLGDLKISSGVWRGRVFLERALRARELHQDSFHSAFGIVMRGTERTPERYTGALGVPGFCPLAEVAVVRIPAREFSSRGIREVDPESVFARTEQLSQQQVRLLPARLGPGSRFGPVGLCQEEGLACAVLEDTLDCKRLYLGEGEELRSCHLSHFAFSRQTAGVQVLEAALTLCHRRDIPALFVSLPQSQLSLWQPTLRKLQASVTGATIYGHGLPEGLDWNINTSEV